MKLDPSTDDLPVFRCTTGSRLWTFFCPWCRTEHIHGEGAGHRVSHCLDGSPFKARGYVLVPGDQPVTPRRMMRGGH